MPATAPTSAPREKAFLLARHEQRLLEALARRLPAWLQPDHLTILGVLAAVGIAAAYALSNRDPAWLWAASALLVVHWLGDSLDGTLARVRRSERPRYGYYLDHLVDAVATALIGIGLGLSPYMLLATGLAIVLAYLVLSINTYLETQVFGTFRLGYGRLGRTEARLALVALNTRARARGRAALHGGGAGALGARRSASRGGADARRPGRPGGREPAPPGAGGAATARHVAHDVASPDRPGGGAHDDHRPLQADRPVPCP